MNSTFRAFLEHLTNHMGQNWSRSCQKSTINGVGRHHFRDQFGPLWPHFSFQLSHKNPKSCCLRDMWTWTGLGSGDLDRSLEAVAYRTFGKEISTLY